MWQGHGTLNPLSPPTAATLPPAPHPPPRLPASTWRASGRRHLVDVVDSAQDVHALVGNNDARPRRLLDVLPARTPTSAASTQVCKGHGRMPRRHRLGCLPASALLPPGSDYRHASGVRRHRVSRQRQRANNQAHDSETLSHDSEELAQSRAEQPACRQSGRRRRRRRRRRGWHARRADGHILRAAGEGMTRCVPGPALAACDPADGS